MVPTRVKFTSAEPGTALSTILGCRHLKKQRLHVLMPRHIHQRQARGHHNVASGRLAGREQDTMPVRLAVLGRGDLVSVQATGGCGSADGGFDGAGGRAAGSGRGGHGQRLAGRAAGGGSHRCPRRRLLLAPHVELPHLPHAAHSVLQVTSVIRQKGD